MKDVVSAQNGTRCEVKEDVSEVARRSCVPQAESRKGKKRDEATEVGMLGEMRSLA